MRIITTHLNADFDCLASMVAAKKLYPDADLVFPGSQEKNVRDFLAGGEFDIPYRKLRGMDMDSISAMVIVDASTSDRIGVFADLANSGKVRVDIYDHHPPSKIDIAHNLAVIRQRGATVTIFVEIFRERGISVSPREATLLALGLYEDTGSLTFSSVCGEDYSAARWLLEQGADLNLVSAHLAHELNAQQIEMLNMLAQNMEYEQVGGALIAVTTGSTTRYIGDLAALAHKLMEAENPSALFVLVRMADRVHLIARSRVDSVDVGVIAEKMGGGGHHWASSATIKKLTLQMILEKLKTTIEQTLAPAVIAGEMMVRQVISVEVARTIDFAQTLMTRYNINAMPVMDNEKVAGLITRQIVERAVYHKLGQRPVSEFMTSEFSSARLDSPAGAVEDIILGGRQRLAPVINSDTGKLEGIISRGMVLGKLYGESLSRPPFNREIPGVRRRRPIRKNVGGLIRELLPRWMIALMETVAQVADENDYSAYVAGGFVRDLLLRAPGVDLDVVIEGDGVDFARKLSARLKGSAYIHEKFKTAVVTTPDRFKLDVATARIEYYAHPAALPCVETSAIRNDLYRRDFTINAMAISLNGPKPYTLIDFFGGQADLKDRAIRVLHNLSFVEDPTRAFRAIRFERRYGFTMGKQTLALLKSAARHKLFNRLSGERAMAELKLILKERRSEGAIARMEELGLLRFIHPRLVFTASARQTLNRLEDLIAWHNLTFPAGKVKKWMTRMMALFDCLAPEDIVELKFFFGAVSGVIEEIAQNLEWTRRALESFNRQGSLPPSRRYELLKPMSAEGLVYMAAKSGRDEIRSAVTNYLTSLVDVRPFISGADVLKLGLTPSPLVGEILSKVFSAQLDGAVTSREQALKMAGQLMVT